MRGTYSFIYVDKFNSIMPAIFFRSIVSKHSSTLCWSINCKLISLPLQDSVHQLYMSTLTTIVSSFFIKTRNISFFKTRGITHYILPLFFSALLFDPANIIGHGQQEKNNSTQIIPTLHVLYPSYCKLLVKLSPHDTYSY